jgi:hypothetical protein
MPGFAVTVQGGGQEHVLISAYAVDAAHSDAGLRWATAVATIAIFLGRKGQIWQNNDNSGKDARCCMLINR